MPRNKGYWKYICDRCRGKIEVPEDIKNPVMYLEDLYNKELFFVRVSKLRYFLIALC